MALPVNKSDRNYYIEVPRPRVLATGVFDVFHAGHMDYLRFSEHLGSLYVGLWSDEMTRRLKGPTRPLNSIEARMGLIRVLGIATECFVMPDADSKKESIEQVIQTMEPNFLTVSSEGSYVNGQKIVLPHGIGNTCTVVLDQGYRDKIYSSSFVHDKLADAPPQAA